MQILAGPCSLTALGRGSFAPPLGLPSLNQLGRLSWAAQFRQNFQKTRLCDGIADVYCLRINADSKGDFRVVQFAQKTGFKLNPSALSRSDPRLLAKTDPGRL